MDPTIGIALISASAGVLGAIAGAVAAVAGPWWLRRDEREVEAKQRRADSRTAAVAEWGISLVDLAIHHGDMVGLEERVARHNSADLLLLAQLELTEQYVAEWMSGTVIYTHPQASTKVRSVAAVAAAERLIAWHRGIEDQLTPFELYVEDGYFKNKNVAEWPRGAAIILLSSNYS